MFLFGEKDVLRKVNYCNYRAKFSSINLKRLYTNIGVSKSLQNKIKKFSKKAEHIFRKSVKMELSRNLNGGINMLYKYFTEKLTGLQRC